VKNNLNGTLPLLAVTRSLPALLTRGLRRTGLDEGTCGGCGCTNGTDAFPSNPAVRE